MTAGLVVRGMTPPTGEASRDPPQHPGQLDLHPGAGRPARPTADLQQLESRTWSLTRTPYRSASSTSATKATTCGRWTTAQFLDFAARELEKIGLIDRRQVLDGTVVRVPKAYPAYFGEYREIGQRAGLPVVVSRTCSPSAATACTATTTRITRCWPPRPRSTAWRPAPGSHRALVGQHRRRLSRGADGLRGQSPDKSTPEALPLNESRHRLG